MAGENIKILAGKPVNLRATASADAGEGDYVMLERRGADANEWGGTAGFWLHDVKKDEVGDVCVYCEIVEIPADSAAHGAGQVLLCQEAGIEYTPTRPLYRNSTANTIIVYEDTPASATRMKVVWGLN